MKRAFVGVVVAAVGTVTVIGAAAAQDPAAPSAGPASEQRAWIAEEGSMPERLTVIVPRHVGAEPLDPAAFKLVVDGDEQPAEVSRLVDEGLDLVLVLDSGRLDEHLLAATGATAELVLQLPESVGVLVWGASAVAPGNHLAPIPPDEAMVALSTLEPAPQGDLGATLQVLGGRLGSDRRHAAVVVTPAGEHTLSLTQGLDEYDAGLRVVELDPGLEPGGLDVLGALDALALELLGTYEVSVPVPARGAVEAVVVDPGDGPIRIPLPDPTPAAEVAPIPTVGSFGTDAADSTLPSMSSVPLTGGLTDASRPARPSLLLGRLAFGAALALSALLVGHLAILMFQNHRATRSGPRSPARTAPEPGPETPRRLTLSCAPAFAELYGVRSDGSTTRASRLLCVVELGAASRLDGTAARGPEIEAALTSGDATDDGGDLGRWVDVLHAALAEGRRCPTAERLAAALARLELDADVADEAERLSNTTSDPNELHRGLLEAGRPRGYGHRLASMGLALLDPYALRPAPLMVSVFLTPSAEGDVDLDAAVRLARAQHSAFQQRTLSRCLVPRPDVDTAEDPVAVVTGLLDQLVPSPRAHQP